MNKFKNTENHAAKYFKIILLSTLLVSIGSNMSMPFMAIYLSKSLGITPVAIGLFMSLGFLSYGLFGLPLGKLIDTGNQKNILLICLIALIFSVVIFFFSRSVYLFYVANFIIGVSQAGFSTVINWYITTHIDDGDKYSAFSFKYIVVNVGASIGPLLGSYYARIGSKDFLLCAASLYMATLFLLAFFLRIEKSNNFFKKNFNYNLFVALKNKLFLIFLIGSVLYNVCYSQVTSTLPLYLKSVAIDWPTIYTAMLVINSMGVILMQYPITLFMSRINISKALLVGSLIFGLSFLLLAFSHQRYFFYLVMCMFTVGEIILTPLSNVLIDKMAPQEQKGAYFGAYNLSFLGSFAGPIFGGAIFQFASGSILYLLLSVFSIVMLVLFFFSSRFVERK